MSPTGDKYEDAMLSLLLEKNKFRFMWELRHLDEEITKEDGVILLAMHDGKFQCHLKNLTQELTDKINCALERLK